MALNNRNDVLITGGPILGGGPSDQLRKMINTAPQYLKGEEFIEKVKLARAGDKAAQQFIIHSNAPLVAKLVQTSFKYNPDTSMSFDDRFQEGSFGLIRAYEKFDIEGGHAFSTYATHWINQNITRGVGDKVTSYGVRLPVHFLYKLSRLRRLRRRYEANPENGSFLELSHDEIIRMYSEDIEGKNKTGIELTHSNIDDALGYLGGSLLRPDTYRRDFGDGEADKTNLWDTIDFGRTYDKYDGTQRLEDAQAVDAVIDALNDREAFVIEARFWNEYTLEEVGEVIGVTRERVRQIEAIALRKMRVRHQTNQLDDSRRETKYKEEKHNKPKFTLKLAGDDTKVRAFVEMGEGLPRAQSPEKARLYAEVENLITKGYKRREILKMLNLTQSQYSYIVYGRSKETYERNHPRRLVANQ